MQIYRHPHVFPLYNNGLSHYANCTYKVRR